MEKFEDQYQQLQKIVETLERGNVGLEESISQFKIGTELVKNLRKQLKKTENELKVLEADLVKDENLE